MNVGPRKDRFDVDPRTQVIYFPRMWPVEARQQPVARSLITCVGHVNLRLASFVQLQTQTGIPVNGRRAGTNGVPRFFRQLVAA